MSKCKIRGCGYQRQREQQVKGSVCPKCKRKRLSLWARLGRAYRAFQEREYQPRTRNAIMAEVTIYKNPTTPQEAQVEFKLPESML